MTLIKTYSPRNEARIVCPIFGSETRLADCFALEQEVARGRKIEERRGCQACLHSSKCPVYWINREIRQSGADHYHSAEAKVVQLRPNILEDIGPIVIQDRHINESGASAEELAAMAAANDACTSGASRKTVRKAAPVKLAPVKASAPSTKAPAAGDDELTRAAISGDLSAAVSKAAAKPAEPAPVPASAPAAPVAKKAPAPVPAAAKPAPATAPAGKGLSLLEMARARAAAKAAA